jgi:LacI family transcriptional regulator
MRKPTGRKRDTKRPATVKDVARVAEVSVATVSHAINNTRKVNPETRERVFAAIRKLGYSGHSIARSLRRGRTSTLGLVVSDIENPFFTKLASHVQRVASLHGYQVIFANSDERADRERQIIDALNAQRVDGIILAPVARENAERLAQSGPPLALVNRHFSGVRAPHVIVDDLLGARLGFDHLWALGHRNIAIIRGDVERSTTKDRIRGLREAHRVRGVAFDETRLINAGYSGDHGTTGLAELMVSKQRPTAVFALSNWALLSGIRGLQRSALRCPADVSLVGYGVSSPYWMPAASVCMVEQPVVAMAEACVRVLLEQIKDGKIAKSVVLPPTLTPGESTRRVEPRQLRKASA